MTTMHSLYIHLTLPTTVHHINIYLYVCVFFFTPPPTTYARTSSTKKKALSVSACIQFVHMRKAACIREKKYHYCCRFINKMSNNIGTFMIHAFTATTSM